MRCGSSGKRKINGQWQACWGGCMRDVSKNQGIWQHPYGTTATGLPFLGGQITAEELQRGEIRHVIGIALVDAEKWQVYSYPANRSDGYNPQNAPNRIPEGLRFRLDPRVDVDALKMHPIGKIIAKAAQKYGFVVWDKAGGISLRRRILSLTPSLERPIRIPLCSRARRPTHSSMDSPGSACNSCRWITANRESERVTNLRFQVEQRASDRLVAAR